MKRCFSLMIILAFILTLSVPVNAAEAVVYVKDGGTGNGGSPSSPVGTLEAAYARVLEISEIKNDPNAEAVIVICGTVTVSDHFNYNGKLAHKGKLTYTSVYGEDFRATLDARLVVSAPSKSALSVNDEHRFVLGGPTRFEALTIDRGAENAVSLTIYATTELYIAESVEVVNTNWARSYIEPVIGLTEDEISSMLLSAHRGYQPMGPENSILSFEAAGKLGFDYIETDVIMTADGELVCMHDATVDRTTNGSGKVTDMTYADIRKLTIDTAAHGFNISTADKDKLYVPTFREYLGICKKYGSKPFIEIKDSREEVINKIIDTALGYFEASEIVMSCGNIEALNTSYKYNRDVFHHLIWGDQSNAGYEQSIVTLSQMTDSKGEVNAGIAFNITSLSNKSNYDRAKSWIDKAHAAGLLTCLRAADDMTEVRLMHELGIDYYPTNTTYPEKLAELREGREGGYSYSTASGGKLFIRGGSRCGVTEDDISITLMGGIFDFVAPSNAEAQSTGKYSVTVGGNAFVSRLVAGETAKSAVGERVESIVKILDNAEVRELYAAGDYSHTLEVIVEVQGGKVLSLTESRGKGGTAQNLTLRLADLSMMPKNVSVSDSSVIKGKKRLELSAGVSPTEIVWDETVVLREAETTVSETAETSALPDTEKVQTEESREERDSPEKNSPMPLIIACAALATIIAVAAIGLRKRKRGEKTLEKENRK